MGRGWGWDSVSGSSSVGGGVTALALGVEVGEPPSVRGWDRLRPDTL